MTTATTSIKKKDLRKALSQWEKGKVTKIEAERSLGIENARGKKIARLWETDLGVDTRYGQARLVAA